MLGALGQPGEVISGGQPSRYWVEEPDLAEHVAVGESGGFRRLIRVAWGSRVQDRRVGGRRRRRCRVRGEPGSERGGAPDGHPLLGKVMLGDPAEVAVELGAL